jgi:hypothetical protein
MLRIPRIVDSQLTDVGEVVSLTRRPRKIPGTRFLERVSKPQGRIVRLEELGQFKNIPVTSSKIEPATSQLVEECLNKLRYRVSRYQGSKVKTADVGWTGHLATIMLLVKPCGKSS